MTENSRGIKKGCSNFIGKKEKIQPSMFVSDADFDFATEQIKKLKLAVFEVTAMPSGSNMSFLVTERAMKTTGNTNL